MSHMGARLLLLALFLSAGSLCAGPCPAYVTRYTPAIFNDDSPRLVPKTDCLSISAGSRPLLVATYSNGDAILTIFDSSSNPPSLVREVKKPMFGTVFDLSAIDLDGDGRKEIVVQSRSRMTEMLWAYSLTDSGIPVLISPDDSIAGPILLDLEGTGKISIIETEMSISRDEDGDTDVKNFYTLYTLQNGKYVKRVDRELFFVRWFEKEKGSPKTEEEHFEVPESGRYRVTLLNGDPDGKNRCSSALVKAGDLTAIGPHDLDQQQYAVTRDVLLPADTTLTVTLRSDTGCKTWILVDRPITPSRAASLPCSSSAPCLAFRASSR